MIFFGLISIFQLFLPGLILTKLFYDFRLPAKLIFSFSISLLFNYQFVMVATMLGFYNNSVVWMLFAFELVLLGYIYLKKIDLSKYTDEVKPKPITSDLGFNLNEGYGKSIKYIFIGLGILILFQFLGRVIDVNPGIFDSWDDVVSWNRWAADWYTGGFPQHTWHYPQLMPANWSMMYQFVGSTDIQFFTKACMSLFALGILLILADLFRLTKSLAFLIAYTATGFLIIMIVGIYIGKGYMDIPVTFFCLAMFYAFYLGMNGQLSARICCVILALLLSAAAVTKQAGLFMILPAIFFIGFLVKGTSHSFKEKRSLVLVSFFLVLSMAGPWYLYKEIQIKQGTEDSEIGYVTQDIFSGKAKQDRLIDGTVNFSERITDFEFLKSFSDSSKQPIKKYFTLLIILIAAMSVFSFYGRITFLLVTIPYYFIWGFFFSYDLRNIAILLPFLGLSVGFGATVLLNFAQRFTPTTNQLRYFKVGLMVVLVFGITLLSLKFDSDYLKKLEQDKARTSLGDAELNSRLYELYETNELNQNVLSSYLFLKYLPGIKQHFESFDFTVENLDALKKIYEDNKISGAYRHFLLHESAPKEVWEFIHQKETEGGLKIDIRSQSGWYIIEAKKTVNE